MPITTSGFENRVSLHQEFRGLRGEELNKAAGVSDAEFVHASGFIGGAWSLESALKMAEASIAAHEENKLDKDLEKKQKIE